MADENRTRYDRSQVYGPVPSRRLGRSLGVDVVPSKSCPYNCVYCQAGRTTNLILEPESFYRVEDVVAVVLERLKEINRPDYLTFSGNGEPTLNRDLGKIIEEFKRLTDIAIAVITNGALLYREEVATGIMSADAVLPSLDAVSPDVFRRLNRPHPDLPPERVIDGLRRFSRRYDGRFLLEIMLVRGLNDHDGEIEKLIEVVKTLELEVVQLNTVVRPSQDSKAEPVEQSRLDSIRKLFSEAGIPCEIIAAFKGIGDEARKIPDAGSMLDLLGRRPCTIDEIAASLQFETDEVKSVAEKLLHLKQITTSRSGGKTYYRKK